MVAGALELLGGELLAGARRTAEPAPPSPHAGATVGAPAPRCHERRRPRMARRMVRSVSVGAEVLGLLSEYARRPPSRPRQVLMVVTAILVPATFWERRGPVVGVVAVAVYGGLLGLGAFQHDRLRAWSRTHPRLDALLMIPISFLAVACLTAWSLPVCLGLAIAAWLLLRPLTVARRRRAS